MLIKIAGHSAGVWTGGTIWAIVMLAEFVEMVTSDSSHHLPTAAEHLADHRTPDQHRDEVRFPRYSGQLVPPTRSESGGTAVKPLKPALRPHVRRPLG